MKPVKIYRSGFVQRYHQNPEMAHFGQTNAAHQWGVAILMRILNRNASISLIMAALTHDVGELDVGDLAGPFKKKHPEFTKVHEALELKYRKATLGKIEIVSGLTDHETQWLKLCDGLEAVLFVKMRQPDLLLKRGWPDMIEGIKKAADELGCYETVLELIDDVSC